MWEQPNTYMPLMKGKTITCKARELETLQTAYANV